MILKETNLLPLALFGIPYLLIIAKVFFTGPILSPDSFVYIEWSKAFLENSSNLINNESVELVQPQIFYTFNILIFSALIFLSPDNWINYFLLLNCFSVAIIFLNLYIFSKKFLKSRYSLLSVPIIYLCSDIFIWSSYIILDTFYAAIVISLMNLLIFSGYKTKFAILIFIFLVLLKPQSLAIGLGVFLIYLILNPYIFSFYKKFTAASLFLIIVVFTSFFALIFSDLALNAFGSQSMNFLKEMIKDGLIVKDRFDGYFLNDGDNISTVIVFIKRFFSFFQPWVLDFSLTHNLMYMTLNISFFLAISIYLFHKYFRITENIFKILSIIFMLILGGAIFHSFTLIDFDFRYRFPYTGPMTLFFALIFEQLLHSQKIKAGLGPNSGL